LRSTGTQAFLCEITAVIKTRRSRSKAFRPGRKKSRNRDRGNERIQRGHNRSRVQREKIPRQRGLLEFATMRDQTSHGSRGMIRAYILGENPRMVLGKRNTEKGRMARGTELSSRGARLPLRERHARIGMNEAGNEKLIGNWNREPRDGAQPSAIK